MDQLTEEVKDIAIDLEWQHFLFDDEDLKGICFSPEECEPVFLTFTTNNKLCSPVSIMYNQPGDPFYYTIFTKTQFAGIDVHITVLKLLYYLQQKYFADFELEDEGLYWNVWDEKILQQQFDKYNYALNIVTSALENFQSIPGETVLSLAERLEQWLKERLGNDKK
ncbi:hypothetical protein BH10BAC2_BH10BAC2_18800 [soil metagenome]